MGIGGREGRIVVGSRHRQPPSLQPQLGLLRHRTRKERVPRAGSPFPAPALIPAAESLEGVAGVAAETGGYPSPSGSGPTPARHGGACEVT